MGRIRSTVPAHALTVGAVALTATGSANATGSGGAPDTAALCDTVFCAYSSATGYLAVRDSCGDTFAVPAPWRKSGDSGRHWTQGLKGARVVRYDDSNQPVHTACHGSCDYPAGWRPVRPWKVVC